MQETTKENFDLLHIIRILKKGWKFIIAFVVVSLVLTVLFLFIAKPRYEATTTFILRHPEMVDRNQSLSQDYFTNKKFFAEEAVIDEIMAIAKSPKMIKVIIDSFDLTKVYGEQSYVVLEKNIKIKRNDTRQVDIKVKTIDRQRSVDIANFSRNYIESEFAAYFNSWNQTMIESLNENITKVNQKLNVLNDSIATFRSQNGLNSQLLPVRTNAIQNTTSASNSKALEQLSDLLKQKDKLAEDVAQYESLINEYSIGLKKQSVNMFFVLNEANKDDTIKVPNKKLLLVAVLIASLLLSSILLVANEGFKRI